MSVEALPCLSCGKRLFNVHDDAENQPERGIACTSYGNYGSEVYDPMNGEFLEFNLCDTCVSWAGNVERVYTARTSRNVVAVDPEWGEMVVGRETAPYRPVLWHAGMSGYDDDGTRLDIEDLDLDNLPEGMEIYREVAEILKEKRHAQD